MHAVMAFDFSVMSAFAHDSGVGKRQRLRRTCYIFSLKMSLESAFYVPTHNFV